MKNVLILFILCVTVSARGQITLTAATSNPLPGDTATYYVVSNVNVGDSGAAVTWDFSTLSPSNKKTIYYHQPGVVCDPSSVPLVATGDWGCDYFQADSNSFSMSHGNKVDSFYAYPDTRLILAYPLTYNAQVYGDGFTRRDSALSWMPPFAWENGHQIISSDAYGTLILPDSTYTDVLRVKKEVAVTYHYFGTSNSFYNTMEVYEWYSINHRHFLLQVTNNIIVGVSGMEQTNPEVSIYPNPAYKKLNIELSNSSVEYIHLNDITGRKMLDATGIKGEQKYTIDVSGLAAGMYFLEVGTIDGVLVRKIEVR